MNNKQEILDSIDDISTELDDIIRQCSSLNTEISHLYCAVNAEDTEEEEVKTPTEPAPVAPLTPDQIKDLIKQEVEKTLADSGWIRINKVAPVDNPGSIPINEKKPWWVYPYTMPDYIYPGRYQPPIYRVESTCSKYNPQDLKANNENTK